MSEFNGNRLDGCLFGAPKPSDYSIDFKDDSLPRQVDLRRHCTAVEDQGRIGSCTANACVGALEYFLAKRDGTAPDLSRMFVYYNTRRLKGTLQQDTGAMVSEAMAAVLAFGACRSELWPYDPNLFSAEPPQQAYMDGRQYEAMQYARVNGVQGALRALAQEYPVVFGTFVPQRCYDEASRTGVIPATTQQERGARPSGGHCMLIVGYDLDREVFIVRNSWGVGWGNGGYCEFPFSEMTWSSPPDSFWILLEMEPPGNFSIVKPMASSAAATDSAPEPSLGIDAKSMRDEIRGGLKADLDKFKDDLKKNF